MATPPQAIRLPPPPAEFGVKVDFIPGTENPARVFRSMTRLIVACEFTDQELAAAFGEGVKPVLLLQNVEAGSIVTWMRSILETIDEDALKSGDTKKIIGTYLVKGRRSMVEFLQHRETISDAGEIYNLQTVLRDAANQTGVPMMQDPPVPARQIAESVKLISDATIPLRPGDQATYITSEGEFPINPSFRVTTEQIEAVLTQQSITSQSEMILKVKRPDLLGDSMWDFRYQGKKLPAKVLDVVWMEQFRRGEIPLRPGDAIHGLVETETKYGQDLEVIAVHYKILTVHEIKHLT